MAQFKVDSKLFYGAKNKIDDGHNHLSKAYSAAIANPPPHGFKYYMDLWDIRDDLYNAGTSLVELIGKVANSQQLLSSLGLIESEGITLLANLSLNETKFDITTLEGRKLYIYDQLVNKYGYPEATAQGIIANMLAECPDLEPTHKQDGGGPGYGICQWEFHYGTQDGRADKMFAYCAEVGLDPNSIDGQIAWMDHELQDWKVTQAGNVYGDLYDDMMDESRTYEQQTRLFCRIYEAPAEDNSEWRIYNGQNLTELFNNPVYTNPVYSEARQGVDSLYADVPDITSVFDDTRLETLATEADINPNPENNEYIFADIDDGVAAANIPGEFTPVSPPNQSEQAGEEPVTVSPINPESEPLVQPPQNPTSPHTEDLAQETQPVSEEPASVPPVQPEPQVAQQPTSQTISETELLQKVRETMRGDYGNDEQRREALGDLYDAVQNQVNRNVMDGNWDFDSIHLY